MLLVVAIALITIDFRDGGNSGAHSVGGRLFGPVERIAGKVTGLFTSGGSGSEVAALQKQNDELRAQLAQAQASNQNFGPLARLLHLTAGKYQVVTGTVIAAGGDYSDTVTLNVGSGDGIAADETVLNGDGLVGTVVSVTAGTATVQLLTDAAATAGVRAVAAGKTGKTGKAGKAGKAGNGQIGALSGTARSLRGGGPLKLTMFSTSAALKPGQQLVTFGSIGGRPYVPGVPVGTVTKVTTQPGSLTPTAMVTPYVDVTGLGVVGVVISR